MSLTHRRARPDDEAALSAVMTLAIEQLQSPFLSPEQVRASRAFMGIDRRLIADGTYFLVEAAGRIAGCGGWSRRATPYGGDHSAGRDDRLLDPGREAAKVRAMYTHPEHARRGIGRTILDECEARAAAEGYRTVELMATMSGRPLYAACGYAEIEPAFADVDGVEVPLMKMAKPLKRQRG